MSKVYTKGGDHGETSLFGGTRTPKNSKRVAAYGCVDQANAAIAVAAVNLKDRVLKDLLKLIQEKLFVVGAELASDEKGRANLKSFILESDIAFLENVIDELSRKLSDRPYFSIPGESFEAAYLHLARTAVRQAEREIVGMMEEYDIREYLLKFINRLSDLLFVISRYVVEFEVKEEHSFMTLELANTLVASAMRKAEEINVPVVISVVDEGGNLVHLSRMQGAHIGSIDISMNKAYTSMALKLTTETLGELCQPGQPLYGIQNTNDGRIVVFGGGIPVYIKGKLIGAIGVSGGSVKEDILIAGEAIKNL